MRRGCWLWRSAMGTLGGMVVSLSAPAQEHGEAAPPSIFEGGLHNVIWTLLIFLTIVFVLGKFAWKPLLGALKQREEFIRNSLEAARREREESAGLLKKYTEQIHRAREEATAIAQEGRRDAEEARRRIVAEARSEADTLIKRARREIEIAHQNAIREIYNSVAELSTDIAGRILRREIDSAEHQELVTKALEELKEQGRASSN